MRKDCYRTGIQLKAGAMHMQLLADPFIFIAGFGLIGILLAVASTLFWIWMLVDAIINPTLRDMEKLIWVAVVLFTHFLGAVLYFLLVRAQRNRL